MISLAILRLRRRTLPVAARRPLLSALLIAVLQHPLAASAAELPLIPMSPAQGQALGIRTQTPALAQEGAATGLPAQVVVPPGQLQALAAPLAGLITQVNVVPGQALKRGQPLARLAAPGLLALGRELLQARQQAELAERSLARDEQLFQEGIIAEARVQATRAAQAQARAVLAEKRAELRLAGSDETLLSRAGSELHPELAIAAPFDGVVMEVQATPGQRVDQAALLFTMARLAPLALDIQVPVALSGRLQPGLPVSVRREGSGAVPEGRVQQVGAQVSGSSQTIQVRALLDRNLGSLRPGEAVEARIQLPATSSPGTTVQLPGSALIQQGKQSYVFVAGEKQGKPGFYPLAVERVAQNGGDVLVRPQSLPPVWPAPVAVAGVAALKAAWSEAASPEGTAQGGR